MPTKPETRQTVRMWTKCAGTSGASEAVGHIQACDFTKDPSLPDTFLIKWTGSWGWATWARAWRHFNPDGKALLAQLEERRLTHTFDFNGNYPFTRMLRRQIAGKNNSWAIRWNASLFLAGILSLNVGKSLVQNTAEASMLPTCGCIRSPSSLFPPSRRTKKPAVPSPAIITAPTAFGRKPSGASSGRCGETSELSFHHRLHKRRYNCYNYNYFLAISIGGEKVNIKFILYIILFKFRKFNLQVLIYKCRKYVSYLPPC